MDYLTKFYKNQAEVLTEQIKFLEMQLTALMESEAPSSTFRGTGAGQQKFSDLELENQMRKHRRTGFLGAEIADEKQSREYLDAKEELERRRGAKQASAVPTRTEVQRTQAVADETGLPTALPTNVRPGTMGMQDMDGRPIAVQPTPKRKMDPIEFSAHAAEAGGDYVKDRSGYLQSRYSPQADSGPVLGRVKPASQSPADRRDLEDSAMGRGQYKPEYVKRAEAETAAAKDLDRRVALSNAKDKMSPSSWWQSQRMAYTPAQEKTTSSWKEKVALDAAQEKMSPTKWWETQKAIRTPAVSAEEDFSDFWAGKPRYGDLELEDMMRKHKRTNMFGPAIPDEKQSREYRAAKAELKKRGKLK